jgi:hypothetical protein
MQAQIEDPFSIHEPIDKSLGEEIMDKKRITVFSNFLSLDLSYCLSNTSAMVFGFKEKMFTMISLC